VRDEPLTFRQKYFSFFFKIKMENKIWQMCRLILPMPLIGSERGRSLRSCASTGRMYNIRQVFLTDGTTAAQ
jgi:hypothetical protein